MKILLKDSDLFFQSHRENFRRDVAQLAVLVAIFSALTVISIEAGWTTVKLPAGLPESTTGIFLGTMAGAALLTAALSALAFGKTSRESLEKSFFILAYASTPAMLIAWFPHGLVKLIGVAWSLVFVAVGLQTSAKRTQKQSILITIGLAILIGILTYLFQNFLVLTV